MCAELVAAKGESITVDELVSEITPHARSTVPDEVKKELLTRIRGFLAQQGALHATTASPLILVGVRLVSQFFLHALVCT